MSTGYFTLRASCGCWTTGREIILLTWAHAHLKLLGMKILLVGADREIREERRELLAASGYEAVAVPPEEVGTVLADTQFSCLVLGSSLGEYLASDLAAHFCAFGAPRFVIRVAEDPPAPAYPYADIVVNPRNPAALLGAVKALEIRSKQPDWIRP